MKNQIVLNKNSFLIIAVVIGVFAVGIICFASWKYSEEISKLENEKFQPVNFSAKKTETIDDISNWKTYRNEEYGFEMKYPKIYVITKENKNSIDFVNKKEKELWEQGKIGSPIGNEISLNVYTIEDKNFIIWREKQLSQNKTKEKVEEIMKNMTKVKTDNYNWMNFSWYEEGWGEMSEFFLQKDNILIEVILSNYKKPNTVFNQMLSTFKFIETDITIKPDVLEIWEPICKEKKLEEFSTTVKKGEGYTHIARRMLENYFNILALKNFSTGQSHIFLTAEEKIYAEDYIRKRFDINNFYTGATIKISCNIIEDAALKARLLTIKQKENLKSYSKNVENFHILELINQVIEESIDKTDDLNIQIFSL